MRLLNVTLAVAFSCLAGAAAQAEGFFDIRGGATFTQNTDGTAKIGPAGGIPQMVSTGKIEFEDARGTFGARGGYWLDSVPWLGFAFDLSYFDPDEDVNFVPVKLDVFPISALLMLRYPLLKSDAYPRGRLQPYAGVGPGAFVTHAKLKLKDVGAPENFSDTTVNLGLDVRGGVNFHFAIPNANPLETLAIFLEYRFLHFKPSAYKEDILGVPFELEADQLDTHHIVFGLGFYF